MSIYEEKRKVPEAGQFSKSKSPLSFVEKERIGRYAADSLILILPLDLH
ncbi:hypothetical protein G6554_03255 [Bacillus sp. MM2020_4]|nr:hypothetical protein [Bacillus sp. MM2020_4]